MEITDPDGVKIRWHKFDSRYRHEVNLNNACPTVGNAIAYAYCTLDSPLTRNTEASLDFNGEVVVYCNDEKLDGDHEFILPLKEGRNHVLLKFAYGLSGQAFSFKLDEEEVRNHKQKYYIHLN